jgi:hypothetical protein
MTRRESGEFAFDLSTGRVVMETGNAYATPSVVVETEAHKASAVSWGAILAGAAGAGALSLILTFLGIGFGMSAISPWTGAGASAKAVGIGSVAWITLTQIAAASLGGYLAGRLRVRWSAVHRDEVHFRDTAHGFVAWAVGTLAVAACLGSTIGAIGHEGAQLSGSAIQGAATAATVRAADSDHDDLAYAVDLLMRPLPNAPASSAPAAGDATPATANSTDFLAGDATRNDMERRGEAMRLFARSLRQGRLDEADVQYLGHTIAARTGASQQDAEAQVRRAYANATEAANAARQAADTARKAAAYTSLWLFVALLAGAFFASLLATFGGRQRDSHL